MVDELGEEALLLDNQMCFALAVAARSVIGLYRPLLDPLGLTHPQYLVMLALWERSPRSVTELSRALAQDPATMSPLLKRLESAGLVERRRSERSERQLDIMLSEQGAALQARAAHVPQAIFERLELPIDELRTLRRILRRVIAAAD